MRPTVTDGIMDLPTSTRNRISHALAALACCYTVIILLGWWLKVAWVQRIIPRGIPIHSHTTTTLLVFSFTLLLSPWERKSRQRLAMVFAVLTATVGSLRIFATLTGRSLWVGDPSSAQGSAVMAMSTAIVFVCLGVACLCMIAPRRRNWSAGVILALVAAGFGAMTVFGHLFNANALYAFFGQAMALPTAILIVLLSGSLISSRPSTGIVLAALESIGSRWLNLPIRYKCLAVVALPVACLIFEIGWQFRVLKGLDEAQQWTTHTQEVELTVTEMQRLLLQIESNDRGYGLSGSEEFLVPLVQQESQVLEVAQRLSRLVEDNPQQSARARNLVELSRAKLTVARDVTAFFASHAVITRAPQEVSLRLLESKARMDEFMEQSQIFAAEEQRLLAQRMDRVRQQQQLSQRVLVLTIFTGLGTGLLAIFLFSWSVANRLTALKNDSRRLAKGEITPAPAAGDDEVSKLAWSLHSASHIIRDQMQGLESLNRDLESFSYSVSHDLRSPLRHIHGFSKILRSDFSAELPAEAQRYLSRIESGAERMGHLIDDLLNFSRLGRRSIECQPVPLRLMVDSVVEELSEGFADRKIEWQMEPLPVMQGDPALVKQIFVNLLGNAIKFTRTRPQARIEVGSRVLPQGTALYVRDNGVGFDMKFADKLFGVFQRLHRLEEFDGTGVGLATVARIVHKHGGMVWAESAVDQGATFYFTLGETVDHVPQPKQQAAGEVTYATAR